MTNSEALRLLHRGLGCLQAMDQMLDTVELQNKEQIMDAVLAGKIKDLSDSIDVVAAHLAKVIAAAAAAGSLTATEISEALTPLISRLNVLGSDPENPTPPDARFAK